jgi:hypothetical protein
MPITTCLRIVVAHFLPALEEGDECGWKVVKVVPIPESAFFVDYSGSWFNICLFLGDNSRVVYSFILPVFTTPTAPVNLGVYSCYTWHIAKGFTPYTPARSWDLFWL